MTIPFIVLIAFALVFIGLTDAFTAWYSLFLQKRGVSPKVRIFIIRLTYCLLTFIFWEALVHRREVPELAFSHFVFAMFIYSFYRLIASFFKNNKKAD